MSKSKSTVAVTLVSGLLTLGLIGLIIAASLEKSLGAGLARLVEDLWGITTLADLGIGLLVIGAWICVLERRPLRCAPWMVALVCVGNLATIVYVLYRSVRARRFRDIFLEIATDDTADRDR